MKGSFRTIELSNPVYEFHGLRFLTVKTENLNGRGDIILYVPEINSEVKDLPIYILLHGVYGSAWVWAFKGGAHKTAKNLIEDKSIKPAILAMPSDGLFQDGSAYFSHHNNNYDCWVVNDVITAIKENIPEAEHSSKTCIGGLSMGGYGALLLGGKFPNKFKAISAHSSITKLKELSMFTPDNIQDYQNFTQTPDVINILEANKKNLPPIRFDCGISDKLIHGNRLLARQLKDVGINHIYEEFVGDHEWSYWNKHLKLSLLFFDKHT